MVGGHPLQQGTKRVDMFVGSTSDQGGTQVSDTDRFPVSDLFLDIAQGKVANMSTVFKFGRHPGVGAVEEVVWDGTGNYIFLESDETIDIVSTSADDTLLGIGARIVFLQGLDSNYNEISELVEMSGLSIVTTSQSFLRLFRVIVVTSGTNSPIGNSNLGDITFTSTDTTTLQAKVLIGNGQTLMAVFTVPAGKTGFVTGIGANAPGGKSALLRAKVRNGPSPPASFSVKYTIDLFQQAVQQDIKVFFSIPEKTDVCFTASSSAAGTPVGASFGMILIDN